MDNQLKLIEMMLKTAIGMAKSRQVDIESKPVGLSRRWSRLRHTEAIIGLLEELQGVVAQDPDHWDDDPELLPF